MGIQNTLVGRLSEMKMESLYQSNYKPLLSAIYNNSRIKTLLFYDGFLLDWLDRGHPEFFDVIEELIGARRTELLSGGFYNPMLSLIPSADRIGQIEKMTTHLRKRFGKRPRGCWIASKMWDESLPGLMKGTGMDYTFLDSGYFKRAGVSGSDLYNPCVTESQGDTVKIFPLHNDIIPIETPEVTIQTLKQLSSDDSGQVVSLIFPAYGEGFPGIPWIEDFLALATEDEDIKTLLPGDIEWDSTDAGSPVYFMSSTYQDLMQWTNNSYGGNRTYRHFINRYPESRNLFHRLLHTNLLVSQVKGDRQRKKDAREKLWCAERHETFWAAPDGGIYDNELRHQAYSSLIKSEVIARNGSFKSAAVAVNYDFDEHKEYIYYGELYNAMVHSVGGILFELDYIPSPWNYLATMSRYEESHIPSGNGEPVDVLPRHTFVDYSFPNDVDAAAMAGNKFEKTSNFHEIRFKPRFSREKKKLSLRTEGKIAYEEKSFPINLSKEYLFSKDGINLTYRLMAPAGLPSEEMLWGSEMNFAFYGVDSEHLKTTLLLKDNNEQIISDYIPESVDGVMGITFADYTKNCEIQIQFNREAKVFVFPVISTVPVNSGITSFLQSLAIVPAWPLRLDWKNDLPPIKILLSLKDKNGTA